MTGIERLREWAKELREVARAYRDREIDYVPLDVEACQCKNAARLDDIADQIEREIEEAVADEVADTLSAYEMNTNARWHSAVEEGAKSDCKAEYELISRYWLPRPRFKDGEPVQFGDKYEAYGHVRTVERITFFKDRWIVSEGFDNSNVSGGPLKRPEPPDSWERIEADAKKDPCVYFGYAGKPCCDGDVCPAYDTENMDECDKCKVVDLVRRCKALAGVD